MANTESDKKIASGIAAVVGANLKRLRKERRLTLSEVSRLSSIAKATLSQLEGGTGNPTIATLDALAQVLGGMPGDLLVEQKAKLRRANEGPFIDGTATHGRLLTRHANSSVDLHEVIFRKEQIFESVLRESDTMEQLYLIDGKLEVKVGGDEFLLDPGDMLEYSLDDGAQIRAIGRDALTLIVMIYSQRGNRTMRDYGLNPLEMSAKSQKRASTKQKK